jgi:hypothetical protein
MNNKIVKLQTLRDHQLGRGSIKNVIVVVQSHDFKLDFARLPGFLILGLIWE